MSNCHTLPWSSSAADGELKGYSAFATAAGGIVRILRFKRVPEMPNVPFHDDQCGVGLLFPGCIARSPSS